MMKQETIYALATAQGKSAIAVIRISGPLACMVPSLFGCPQSAAQQVNVLRLKDSTGQVIDEVVYFCFHGPASSTGEDVSEIHCHGSHAVISEILGVLATSEGFRMAAPGEFTRRSIDNGKMDLTAAEGLADLIDAETSRQRAQAAAQMFGRLSTPVSQWRENIISQAALIESLIDFSDEELPASVEKEIEAQIATIIQACEQVLDDGHIGEIVRNGISIAIIGPVNAGKSTTLNALARRPAAIVSDHAGTTRDVIEVKLDIEGIAVSFMDTAGFRNTDNEVEKLGIEIARQKANEAHFRIITLDASQPDWHERAEEYLKIGDSAALIVANKADKLTVIARDHFPHKIGEAEVLLLSLQDGQHAELLEQKVADHVKLLSGAHQDPLITRIRHREALISAKQSLEAAQKLCVLTQTELVAEEYRAAAAACERILGRIDVEDVLDNIFSRFCIGK